MTVKARELGLGEENEGLWASPSYEGMKKWCVWNEIFSAYILKSSCKNLKKS